MPNAPRTMPSNFGVLLPSRTYGRPSTTATARFFSAVMSFGVISLLSTGVAQPASSNSASKTSENTDQLIFMPPPLTAEIYLEGCADALSRCLDLLAECGARRKYLQRMPQVVRRPQGELFLTDRSRYARLSFQRAFTRWEESAEIRVLVVDDNMDTAESM